MLGEEHPHPRAYGTFPRILRKYVREEHQLTLEDAIRKFSALPAQRMHLTDRGVLKLGLWADVVVFDPETITDRATFSYAERAGRRHAVGAGERRAGDRRRKDDRSQTGPRVARTRLRAGPSLTAVAKKVSERSYSCQGAHGNALPVRGSCS